MSRITTQMVSRNVLADLNNTAERLDRTRSKASSGKEITRPSDDPFGAARALKLRETLAGTAQHTRNAQDALGWQDATESALQAITEIVHRVRTLAAQGATDTADPGARAAAAIEVAQLVESLKEQANASYAGRYIFGGTATTAPPYAAGADDAYRGDDGLIARELGPGVSITLNLTGSSVIGAGGTGLLGTLRSIQAQLERNDGPGLRASALSGLDTGLESLLAVRARNGAGTDRVEAAMSRLDQYAETTTRQLSDTEDADFAQTMIDLNSQQSAYQAALRAGADIVQSSLMDFLR